MFQHCGIHTGGIGCNINVSNVLAAVFIATGQDVGCITESASAQLIITPATEEEIRSQGLHRTLSGTNRYASFRISW